MGHFKTQKTTGVLDAKLESESVKTIKPTLSPIIKQSKITPYVLP